MRVVLVPSDYRKQFMANHKPKVLVVDDDPGMVEFARDALTAEGFEVISANNGEQGLRLLKQEAVELVIIDILMPVKDGLETMMELRKAPKSPKVIAMSGGGAFHLAGALSWAEKLGAQRTLHKPFTPDELIAAVRRTLGQPGE
jgi:DNA-binding response OmpR family regulator